jgi:serine/threonine-protein kinase
MPPPKTIGSYAVERELGRGGMGIVYLGRHPLLDRPVVLKTLRKEAAEQRAAEERFQREARAAAAIHHQNVVAVYDSFAWRNRAYICQEYVDGVDLASVMGSVARVEPRMAQLIALELARGLEAIHALGIVHRDLKPSNVLISRRGEVKVADFGIALDARGRALTQTGYAMGTPRYMSPEQLYGDRVDTRSDLFSVGVVLYEMLTARTPFDPDESVTAHTGSDAAPAAEQPPEEEEGEGLIRRIETERFPNPRGLAPGVPRSLVRLLRSCLRAKAKRRIASCEALRRELETLTDAPPQPETQREIAAWLARHDLVEAVDDQTAVASAAPVRQRLPKPQRWAAAAAALFGLLAAGAWALDRSATLVSESGQSVPSRSYASSLRF